MKKQTKPNYTPNDLSHQPTTLLLGMELSNKKWVMCFSNGQRLRHKTIRAGDQAAVSREIERAKTKLGLAADCPVYSVYEAGRDGFWVHRFLERLGVVNRVLDPASIEVNRRARRAKTDRIDAEKLVRLLMRMVLCGEPRVGAVVRVPTREQEAAMRVHRERERLIKEATGHRNRIRSLLLLHGIRVRRLEGLNLQALRDWAGEPLPEPVREELEREQGRLALVREQVRALEQQQKQQIQAASEEATQRAARLKALRGVGLQSSWLLSHELFWRDFANRKQVGACAGLVASPYASGQSQQEQGISKAGNRRVRTLCVELAWGWLRFQPQSALSRWFREHYGGGTKRQRRVGIVALARKLLVALWKYLQWEMLPEGAVLKS